MSAEPESLDREAVLQQLEGIITRDVPPKRRVVFPPFPDDLQLRLVQVISRHGERTPVRATDLFGLPVKWNCSGGPMQRFEGLVVGQNQLVFHTPFVEKTLGSCFPGELTPLGLKNTFSFGEDLRKHYVDKLGFLPDRLPVLSNGAELFMRCTRFMRVRMSLLSIAAGLYPPDTRPPFSIPFFERMSRDETMYPRYGECDRLEQLRETFLKDNENQIPKQVEELWDKLSHCVARPSEHRPVIHRLFDEISAREAHGLPVPETISAQFRDEINEITTKFYFGVFNSDEALRLGIGTFLSELYLQQVSVLAGMKPTRMALFAGHDATIAAVRAALVGVPKKWPRFGANVVLEVFERKEEDEEEDEDEEKKDKSRYFVRALFDGHAKVIRGCESFGFKGDDHLCPMRRFSELVASLRPKDWKRECESLEEVTKYDQDPTNVVME